MCVQIPRYPRVSRGRDINWQVHNLLQALTEFARHKYSFFFFFHLGWMAIIPVHVYLTIVGSDSTFLFLTPNSLY